MAYGSGSAPASHGGTFRPSMGRGTGCTTCSAGGSGTAPDIGFSPRPRPRADAKKLITWDTNVDSTVRRAHQHAARARKKGKLQKEPPGGVTVEPDNHGLGRGGLTTKLHLAVEQGQKPMPIVITAGQRGDSPQSEFALNEIHAPRLGPGRPRTRPDRVRADKAYASRKNHAYLRQPGSTAPSRTRPTRPPAARNAARAAATEVRPAGLQDSARGRVRHQPSQKAPRPGYAIRQARGLLQGDRPRRGHQRVAVSSIFTRLARLPFTPPPRMPERRPGCPRRHGAG
ncbi:Transposase DDE domain-containing protein [Streptomyces sp. Ncost-T6T-2b]|nr:Transposase DDE domain-containing protein [Streptomyces sp. Ncost-T6T-2b]